MYFCFFSYACHEPQLVSHETASSSAECSRDKPPFSFVKRQDSTIWDIVWVSPQGHRSVSVSRHFLLQAPQCPCSVRKRFSRDHCCRGRSKPSCRIVGSHTRWELTTWANFQLCLHRLLMSTGCKSSHSGFLDVSHSNGGLRMYLNDTTLKITMNLSDDIWFLYTFHSEFTNYAELSYEQWTSVTWGRIQHVYPVP